MPRRDRQPDAPVEVPAAVVRRDPAHGGADGTLRRSCIDPCTCEPDYSDEEREWMLAVEKYKRLYGRPFPTCSELLEVARSLGYRKVTPAVALESLPRVGKRRNEEPPHESAPAPDADAARPPRAATAARPRNRRTGRPCLPDAPCVVCGGPIPTRNGTGHGRCRRCYMQVYDRVRAGLTTWAEADAQLRAAKETAT